MYGFPPFLLTATSKLGAVVRVALVENDITERLRNWLKVTQEVAERGLFSYPKLPLPALLRLYT